MPNTCGWLFLTGGESEQLGTISILFTSFHTQLLATQADKSCNYVSMFPFCPLEVGPGGLGCPLILVMCVLFVFLAS